jgi:hypothetical protein
MAAVSVEASAAVAAMVAVTAAATATNASCNPQRAGGRQTVARAASITCLLKFEKHPPDAIHENTNSVHLIECRP